MTRPHFFALIPEDSPFGGWIKFFMRAHVFSTGQRGRVLESVYLTLKHDGTEFPFRYWMYGEREQLVIGSGLFVGHQGMSANHHFVPTGKLTANDLTSGTYEVEVYGSILGENSPKLLYQLEFELTQEEAATLKTSKDKAVYFLWDQEAKTYRSRIDQRQSRGRAYSVSGSGNGPFSWE